MSRKKPPRSLASALHLPHHWGDGAGLDGLDAEHHNSLQKEALASSLQALHASGRPFGWLRPNVLLAVNPGRPIAGLHGDLDATSKLHNAATWHGSGEVTSRTFEAQSQWPAHPFAVGEAMARRAAGGEDACVCVLGESGSGKTEVNKLILLHLLNLPRDATSTYHLPDAGLIAGGAPNHRALGLGVLLGKSVLEAFTHAASPTNANASRVLIATRLTLSRGSGLLVGCKFQPASCTRDAPAAVRCLATATSTSSTRPPRRHHPMSFAACTQTSCGCSRRTARASRRLAPAEVLDLARLRRRLVRLGWHATASRRFVSCCLG